MNQIFEMKLRPNPFKRICSGEKIIEYRLHDEKRSLLSKGDYIRFAEIADEARTVLVEIIDIFTAPSFFCFGTATHRSWSHLWRSILANQDA